jgi:hypothetical protein
MADPDAHEQAVADELNRIGPEIGTDRCPHETNDEYGYRLIAVIEGAIDEHEVEIAHLDRLRATVKALL